MVVRKESGRRYSKVVVKTFEVAEFAQAFAELGTVKPFQERVDDVVASARAFLAERGIPGCAQLYQSRQTGKYQCAKLDARDRGGFCPLDIFVIKHLDLERDSSEHLAARVIVAADAMQNREGEHALEAAFKLGTLEILSWAYAKESQHLRNISPKDKSRKWAKTLAERLVDDGATDQHTARAMIPEERGEFRLDEDHGFYLTEEWSDRKHAMVEMLILIDPVTETRVDKMTWENFEKRYLRTVLKKAGQQRR